MLDHSWSAKTLLTCQGLSNVNAKSLLYLHGKHLLMHIIAVFVCNGRSVMISFEVRFSGVGFDGCSSLRSLHPTKPTPLNLT